VKTQHLRLIALLLFAPTVFAQVAVKNQGYIPFSEPPINYRSDDLHDPVAALQSALDRGEKKLEFDARRGYLPSVLKQLGIPLSSQTLVFSKTSFQYPKISPSHPRALYFNDDVYVGSVHEGKAVEIVSFDPSQGAIFYLLDEHETGKPAFQRAELDCTQCHIAPGTRGVPGVLLRSVHPTAEGTLVAGARTFITDQESPLAERWGGWYLTGLIGAQAGLGNAATAAGDNSPTAATKLVPLAPQFQATDYLSTESDEVAHLVLAHQTQMHNLITLTNYKTRIAQYGNSSPEAVQQALQRPAEQLLRYLLFVNEAALPGDGGTARNTSRFAKDFSDRGLKDKKGRSLRDFDLNAHIFKYRCSYLIYSDAFEHLPQPAKGYVFHRLFEVLSGADNSADFAHLSAPERRNILEIIVATKPNLPSEWQQFAKNERLETASEPQSVLAAFNQSVLALPHSD
jgi:hypothetical protein